MKKLTFLTKALVAHRNHHSKPTNLSEIAEKGMSLIEVNYRAALETVKTSPATNKESISAIGAIEAQRLAALGNIQNSYIGGVSRIRSANIRAFSGLTVGLCAGLFGYLYFDKERAKIQRKNSKLSDEKDRLIQKECILELEKEIVELKQARLENACVRYDKHIEMEMITFTDSDKKTKFEELEFLLQEHKSLDKEIKEKEGELTMLKKGHSVTKSSIATPK